VGWRHRHLCQPATSLIVYSFGAPWARCSVSAAQLDDHRLFASIALSMADLMSLADCWGAPIGADPETLLAAILRCASGRAP
jgi:hypothetical protein